jgi:hypothetical protein
VLFRSAAVTADELARVTGWQVKPEGLCREDRCVPFVARDAHRVALSDVAAALGSPLVHDARHGLWALGAEGGGRALATATAPDLALPDANGHPFRLGSLRGRKVLLVAWASW